MAETNPPNFVIAISSVSGGGKTTLVRKTAQRLNAIMMFFDDYAQISQYPKDLEKWLEDGADVNLWKTPQFARDVATLRNGESVTSVRDGSLIHPTKTIVIEEPMGRTRAEMAPHIDYVAVIDTPLEIALARRMLRDTKHFAPAKVETSTDQEIKNSYEQLQNYLPGFLDAYLRYVRNIYIAIQDQALATSDLVLDGMLSADTLAELLVAAVKKSCLSRQ